MKKLILPIFLYSQLFHAQTGLWLDASISKKWNKSIKTNFETGYRYNAGIGFDRLYMELGSAYQITDGIKLVGAYRLVTNEKGDRFVLSADRLSHRFQISTDISILDAFDIGPKRLDLSWSSTQQWGIQTSKQMSSIWRNKLSLSYNLKRSPFTPAMSAEHFYRWNANVVYTPTEVLIAGATVQWRYFIGTVIDLPKKQELKFQVGLRNRTSGTQTLARFSYSKQF